MENSRRVPPTGSNSRFEGEGVVVPFADGKIWQAKSEPKMQSFCLAHAEKTLMADRPAERGWRRGQACKLCHIDDLETNDHIGP